VVYPNSVQKIAQLQAEQTVKIAPGCTWLRQNGPKQKIPGFAQKFGKQTIAVRCVAAFLVPLSGRTGF
jgi:hypothetical protein